MNNPHAEWILSFSSSVRRSYIVKELSVVDLWALASDSWIFSPPYFSDTQSSNLWLEKYFHGMRWSDGAIPYSNLSQILNIYTRRYDKIYVQGGCKIKTLTFFISGHNIINLKSLGCPSVQTLPPPTHTNCLFHSSAVQGFRCAKGQAMALPNWIKAVLDPEENWDDWRRPSRRAVFNHVAKYAYIINKINNN